jgi:hypothetical protein
MRRLIGYRTLPQASAPRVSVDHGRCRPETIPPLLTMLAIDRYTRLRIPADSCRGGAYVLTLAVKFATEFFQH